MVGCATIPQAPSGNYQERILQATFRETYDGVIKSFQDAGFHIKTQDLKSGIIETDWKPESSLLAGLLIGKLQSRIWITMTRMDDSHTRVHADIMVEKQSGEGKWGKADLVREKDYVQLLEGIQENIVNLQKLK